MGHPGLLQEVASVVTRPPDHAVVIGAGVAGLTAAVVLAQRFTQVTVLERDQLRSAVAVRRGVPQGRHGHVLLVGGSNSLERLLPGLIQDLLNAGARPTTARDGVWYQEGGVRAKVDSSLQMICLSRPLLEAQVRSRVLAIPNISLVDGARVRELRLSDDGRAVIGVSAQRDGSGREVGGSLVVDASGRPAALLRQLEQAGFPPPPVSNVTVDMGYATHVIDRLPGDLGGCLFAVALREAPSSRGGFVLPIEGGQWIVSLAGAHGDHPPTQRQGFVEFARSLPLPEIGELAARAPDSGAAKYRLNSSQRRHFERLRRAPRGYIALGDALCAFNPVYGQGMTSAVQQAEALGKAIDRHGPDGPDLGSQFYRRAARVVATPWRMAVGTDFNLPGTTGPKPLGTDLVNRYMHHVLRACHSSPEISEQMLLVQNLLAPPTTLMRPDRVLKVLLAARSSPAAAAQDTPRGTYR